MAVDWNDWEPSQYTSIRTCSVHFVGGEKSNDPLSPAYIRTSRAKTKAECEKKKLDAFEREAANDLLTWSKSVPQSHRFLLTSSTVTAVITEIFMADIANLED